MDNRRDAHAVKDAMRKRQPEAGVLVLGLAEVGEVPVCEGYVVFLEPDGGAARGKWRFEQ